ncbi:hypothetical protein C942_00365 [Photobacterium marinum]|uniref:Uncharacterized protein n=1 Tax=Photobacterium marinum TaxID=1056511 RepID=L8JF95_9GAMM|nr:hypothetical protein C942_00365 [Photobacterium marinum]
MIERRHAIADDRVVAIPVMVKLYLFCPELDVIARSYV